MGVDSLLQQNPVRFENARQLADLQRGLLRRVLEVARLHARLSRRVNADVNASGGRSIRRRGHHAVVGVHGLQRSAADLSSGRVEVQAWRERGRDEPGVCRAGCQRGTIEHVASHNTANGRVGKEGRSVAADEHERSVDDPLLRRHILGRKGNGQHTTAEDLQVSHKQVVIALLQQHRSVRRPVRSGRVGGGLHPLVHRDIEVRVPVDFKNVVARDGGVEETHEGRCVEEEETVVQPSPRKHHRSHIVVVEIELRLALAVRRVVLREVLAGGDGGELVKPVARREAALRHLAALLHHDLDGRFDRIHGIRSGHSVRRFTGRSIGKDTHDHTGFIMEQNAFRQRRTNRIARQIGVRSGLQRDNWNSNELNRVVQPIAQIRRLSNHTQTELARGRTIRHKELG